MKTATIFLIAFLTITNVQETDPVLLKAAPEGWRFERLDFPLEFASDLDLDGFEELWFAPGMFDPTSESWFSYVLAMQFEHQEKLESEFVRDVFQKYFRGLCDSVSKSRSLELDLDKIETAVEFRDGVYHVTVNMFDPFVTGDELVLQMQVTSHATTEDSKIVLLGLASPAESDAEIWKQLESFRTDFGK